MTITDDDNLEPEAQGRDPDEREDELRRGEERKGYGEDEGERGGALDSE